MERHIQSAIERTARIQAEEFGGELHSTPRSLEEDATQTVETLGRGRLSSQRGASEEAPVGDVRAGSADARREPQTTEDEEPKNLSEILGRTSLLSKSTLSLPLQRGRLFAMSKRNCASSD